MILETIVSVAGLIAIKWFVDKVSDIHHDVRRLSGQIEEIKKSVDQKL